MEIQLIAAISGTRNGEAWPAPGEPFEVSDDEGAQLIGAQLAVEHDAENPWTRPTAQLITATAPAEPVEPVETAEPATPETSQG